MLFGDKGVAFIQWKNTDICMDFFCECGAQHHYDGFFAYAISCPDCGAIYEMDYLVKPRRVEKTEYSLDPVEVGTPNCDL